MLDLDEQIADEAVNGIFKHCANPDCDRWVTEKVAYCCASCEIGHTLDKRIAHDAQCHHRALAYFQAWGSETPPWKQRVKE